MPSTRSVKRSRLAALAAGSQVAESSQPAVAIAGLDAWAIRSKPSAIPRLVIAIRTRSGVTGYGETGCGPDPDSSVAEAMTYSQALAGQDAMASVAVEAQLVQAPPSIRSAVDIALNDISGKVADAPVYDVVAGRTRDKIRAMAALSGVNEAELMEQLAAAREAGFRAFSVPVLMPEDTPMRGRNFFADIEAMLTRMRNAGADDLVLDCGKQLTVGEGASLAACLENFHLMWMDEPTGPVNDQALRKISHETVTPIAWGRDITSGSRFQDLLRMQVVDAVRPNVCLVGIGGCRRAAALAEAYYTAIAPFHRGGPIGTAAALQVAASVPNSVALEVEFSTDQTETRMHESITGGPVPKVVDGFFELPTGPGLSVEVSEDALQEYAI